MAPPKPINPSGLFEIIDPKRLRSNNTKKKNKPAISKGRRKCRICGCYDEAHKFLKVDDISDILIPLISMLITKHVTRYFASQIMESPFNCFICFSHVRETFFFMTKMLGARYIKCHVQVERGKLEEILQKYEDLKIMPNDQPLNYHDFSLNYLTFFQNHRLTTEDFLEIDKPISICNICLYEGKSEKFWNLKDDPLERSFWYLQAGFTYNSTNNGHELTICRTHLEEYTFLDIDNDKRTPKRRLKNLNPSVEFVCSHCNIVRRGREMVRLPLRIQDRITCYNFLGIDNLYENGLNSDPPIMCRRHFPPEAFFNDNKLNLNWIYFTYRSEISSFQNTPNQRVPRKRCLQCQHLRFNTNLVLIRKCDLRNYDDEQYNLVANLFKKNKYVYVCKLYLEQGVCPV